MLELEESEKNASMLTLALADKKAQHQIEVNKNMALQRQLENSQQNETRLKNTVADFQNSLSKLQEVAEGTDYFMRNVASQMDDALRKLPIFSQRINFACGRIKFLEGQSLKSNKIVMQWLICTMVLFYYQDQNAPSKCFLIQICLLSWE